MSTLSSVAPAGFDVEKIREDFPVLKQKVHGMPLVYLDSAATAQKPFAVIDAIRRFHGRPRGRRRARARSCRG